ncbi:hypothetical protein M409DRAFT_19787 [Zasmidium cellare ATCC 36951]|uniref:Uncharacterized protein n=1 Tax=Zasmidium cellare ATCC 36951 TaxID=1080233 RepID=A0A6A6CSQ9_ZASCE|nr:uncharacterized protein M409DRAFT_19787 [Zasmidium cellare ATCC 36951]KAF2170184.1 hypothetical protein M409DRAFT_19787 [Zasmidium cellare ATCC 36951]
MPSTGPYKYKSRKRPLTSTSQSGRKRHQGVHWSPNLEAEASGTGNTDTRQRNPNRPSFSTPATVPDINFLHDPEDRKVLVDLQLKLDTSIKHYGVPEFQAEREFRASWTKWVEKKYGDRRVMTAEGPVEIQLQGQGAGSGPVGDGEGDEEEGPEEGEEDGEKQDEDEDEEGEYSGIDSEIVEHMTRPGDVRPPAISPGAPARKIASKIASKAKDDEKLFSKEDVNDNGKDKAVCGRLYELIADIRTFANKFTTSKEVTTPPAGFLDSLLKKENEQLIRYIGCLSQGGKNGRKDWEDLVTAQPTREALVVGILGRALKEHVFSDLWFGSDPDQKEDLSLREKKTAGDDGFARTRARAKRVQEFNKKPDQEALFKQAVNTMTRRLEKLLAPFYDGKSKRLHATFPERLHGIVRNAGELSRLMRLAPDVAYYWTSTFKDEEFAPGQMECYNLRDMILKSPYEKKVVGGMERAVAREGASPDQTEAIVKIVCFPGLDAYRQSGGSLAQEELSKERSRPDNAPPDVQAARKKLKRNGDDYDGSEGFRSKTICKNVVYLIWGKQRLLTREAGTSRHIDAVRNGNMDKYTKDYEGFVELYDLAQDKWEREAVRASPSRGIGGLLGRS